MFKELKVIKLIVFVGLLVAIILKMNTSQNIINEIYTDRLSYYPNENIKLFSSTNSFFSFKRNISVTDISGNEISLINLELQQQSSNSNPLIEGLGYENYSDFKFPQKTKSGIYLIENKFPIIIKSKQKADITIVYPYANNILYQSYNDQNVFSAKTKHSSLDRSAPIDKYSVGLSSFFSYLDSTYTVNYISDLDLENIDNYKDSKLLVLYGKSTCWTPKMRQAFNDDYLLKGGNVMLITTNTLNNVCWYEESQRRIIMYNDSSAAMISWLNYNGESPEKIIGISYDNGGYSSDSTYKLAYDTHPILKNIVGDELTFKGNLFSSPPVRWFDDLPRIDLDSMYFHKGEIIAYNKASYHQNQQGIKGIFVLHPDSTSGKIVSLGTEDWCLKENYGNNKSIQLITKNTVDYLLR